MKCSGETTEYGVMVDRSACLVWYLPGKKWSTMPEEKKEKYKQQYVALKAAYDTELKTFYEAHPDAKPPPKQTASSKYVSQVV